MGFKSVRSDGVQTLMNDSSAMNRLPDITRNESDMADLHFATLKVQKAARLKKVAKPRILLLS